MAQFKTIAVLLMVLLAVAEASIYRTTTTEIEGEVEEGNQSRQRCQREMQGMQMNRCMRYLEQQSQYIMTPSSSNPTRQMRQQCCNEMRQVSEDCRCEAVREMMRDMRQGGEFQGQEMREMMETASRLPSMCGMRPQYCTIRGRGY